MNLNREEILFTLALATPGQKLDALLDVICDGDSAFHTRFGSSLQAPMSPSNSIQSISCGVNALNTDYGRNL